MKTTIIGAIIIGVFLIGLLFAGKKILNLEKTVARIDDNMVTLSNSQKTSVQKIDSFRSESKALVMSVYEIKETFPSLVQDLKNEDIKIKNVLSVSTSINDFVRSFVTKWHDSIIVVNGDTARAKCSDFVDRYIQFHSCDYNNQDHIKILVPDTAVNALYKKPRTLWRWLAGDPKQYYLFIKNTNPYIDLKYNQTIQVTK